MTDYKTYGLLGEDISMSISTQIYNALLQELKISAVYLPFAVQKDKFISALPILRSYFSGFNVGDAFGTDITAHLDVMDDSARRAGAANTVTVINGKLKGYNTDIDAFEKSLIGFTGNLFDKEVLLIGSGGSAYAISNTLLERGAFLTIVADSFAKAIQLQSWLQKRYNKNRIKVVKGLSHSDEFYAVFNTIKTDLEGKQSQITIHQHTYQNMKYAYDICYKETGFLQKANEFGSETKNGFDMLFYNAIGAIKIWLDDHSGIDVALLTQIHDKIINDLSTQVKKQA